MNAHDPDTDKTWAVRLPDYINHAQFEEATGRPDMILQLAHFVAADLRSQGMPHVQVRTQANFSLNGRAFQLLIDPNTDLAVQPRTLGHATWITTLTVPLSERRDKLTADTAESAVDR